MGYCKPCKAEVNRIYLAGLPRQASIPLAERKCTRCRTAERAPGRAVCPDCRLLAGAKARERSPAAGLFKSCKKCGATGAISTDHWCKRCRRSWWMQRKYGITIEQYDAILAAQHGLCAICRGDGDGASWHVDHCHDSGRVRGILCALCNRGLGHFRESSELLRGAADYLER